jgi:hypothetical protein
VTSFCSIQTKTGVWALTSAAPFRLQPDLVARVKHQVEFRPYDRSTFYVPGPDQAEGYTTYPVEYGPEGKLEQLHSL